MKRILFVDDEQSVLDGLRSLLRKERKIWDMIFVCGSAAALAELRRSPFDVVVSDMRMPGMDGAELLEQVKRLQPEASRIVLSGHADRAEIARAQAVAHHFLTKPCPAEVLRETILSAVAMGDPGVPGAIMPSTDSDHLV